MFVFHLRSLDDDMLAGWMYKVQVENGWPGLAKETKEICEKLKIEDVNKTKLSEKEYKKLIDLALKVKDRDNILKQSEDKVKCKKIKEECYGKKSCFAEAKICEVRDLFKTGFGLQPFAGNFSHDRRFARTNWLCKCLSSRELEDHIRSGLCPVYGDIQRKYGVLKDDYELQ